jgi:hypothetical protein
MILFFYMLCGYAMLPFSIVSMLLMHEASHLPSKLLMQVFTLILKLIWLPSANSLSFWSDSEFAYDIPLHIHFFPNHTNNEKELR